MSKIIVLKKEEILFCIQTLKHFFKANKNIFELKVF